MTAKQQTWVDDHPRLYRCRQGWASTDVEHLTSFLQVLPQICLEFDTRKNLSRRVLEKAYLIKLFTFKDFEIKKSIPPFYFSQRFFVPMLLDDNILLP